MGKTVLLVTAYYPPDIGGVATHVAELALHLVHSERRPVVYCAVSQLPSAEPPYETIAMRKVGPKRYWQLRFAFGLRSVAARLASRGPLVIHAHCVPASAQAAWISGRHAKVYTNHTSSFLERRDRLLWRLFYRMHFAQFSHIIAPSEELRQATSELGLSAKVLYIPNGVDTARFTPGRADHIRQVLAPDTSTLVVLCPRRLVWKNGCEYLVKACIEMPRTRRDIVVVFAGDGPERQKLEMLAQKAPPWAKCVFLGSVPNDQMVQYYRASDVVVLPSLLEAVSIAALEAGACAKPILATDVGGLPACVLEGETGWLVPSGAASPIARQLTHIANMEPKYLEAMGQKSRKHIRDHFSWDAIVRQTANVYDASLAEFSAPRSGGDV